MSIITRRGLGTMGAGLGLAMVGGRMVRAAGAKQIRIGTIGLNNSPWHKALLRFKEVAEAKTGGSLSVSVYTDGQLGDIGQMLSGMQLGTIEMGYFGLSSTSFMKGAEAMNALFVPYLFPDSAAAERICNGPVFKELYDRIAQTTKVRVLGARGQRSPRALQSVSGPITEPGQVKGLRLRVPAIDILKATFETMGAQTVPLGMLEIYTALSRKTVDGQDNGFDLSTPARFYEVAKYWTATDHVLEMVGFFMGERVWQTLSGPEREALDEAMIEGGKIASTLTQQLDDDSVDIMKKAGCTYTVPDLKPWREAVAGVSKRFDGKLWPEGMIERMRQG